MFSHNESIYYWTRARQIDTVAVDNPSYLLKGIDLASLN